MSRDIKIGLCGLGSIGKAAARLLIDHRSGFSLVGAITKAPEDIGHTLGEVVGSSRASDIVVGSELDELLALQPDIVVYATGSFLKETADDVIACTSAGVNVVSPCEELAFPFLRDADASARIDAAARSRGVTVLGTGVNPGFIFDTFLIAASGCSWDVESITGRRVVDVAGFGQNIHRRLGIGYTPEEFEAGHRQGTIAGHVGFPESVQLVAERLGLTLDTPVKEVFDPFVAETPVHTTYGDLAAGLTEGFVQRASGTVNGAEMIAFELVLHLRPAEAGMEASDSFTIHGSHPVSVTLRPGMDAIPATSAQLVNSIPGVLNAAAGLKTVKDLPSASAWTSLERTMWR
ncbi:2,4-diaminopentanoate dehydrogenase [Kribbella sancticallisti]|uniref:2,4-diaminopentanoate dehydrogenase n=1 Tax=Kribbella sancticallisti TaxID=460087 RepID=A0ABP4QRX4_9ACTN